MEDLAGLFLRTLLIGVAVAAPVGAMGVLCIQRTIQGGWRAGLATGAGIATADAAFAAVAAFGLSALSQWLIAAQAPLRIGGGLVLIWLGVRAMMRPPEPATPAAGATTGGTRLYATAVGLTLTNPMTIIAFAGIFAGAGLVAQPGVGSAIAATIGVAAGSFLWWLTLVSVVVAVRHALTARTQLIVNRLSGAVLIAFGIAALITGLRALG